MVEQITDNNCPENHSREKLKSGEKLTDGVGYVCFVFK